MQLLLKAGYNANLLLPLIRLFYSVNAYVYRPRQLISLFSLVVGLAAKLSRLVLALAGSELASRRIIIVVIINGKTFFFNISLYNLYTDNSALAQHANSDAPVMDYLLVHNRLLVKVIHLVPYLVHGRLLAKPIHLVPRLAQFTARLFH